MVATAVATRVALCVTADDVWGHADDGRAVVGGVAGLWEILSGFGAPILVEAVLPSHWGPLRRRAFGDRLRRVADDVAVRPVAVAAAEVHIDDVGLPTRHVVVVEVAAQAATATLVSVRPQGTRIVGCEHRARVGAEEFVDVTGGLVDVVLGDRMPDAVLILGADDLGEFDAVGGWTTPVHRVDPAELVAAIAGVPRAVQFDPPQPVDVWPATVPAGGSHRVRWAAGVSAAVVACACAATMLVTPWDRPSEVVSYERVSFELPSQWRVRAGFPDHSGRIELIPDEGSGTRIVLISNRLDDGVGYDEVADALADRIAARGADGPFSGLTSDVVFAGRPGLSYREVPEPSSVVDWHVTVDRSLQVSVGCQRRADAEPEVVGAACEQVVRSLAITDE
jgi:type VII secretion-associated protein (TIGR03931 family)